MRRPTHIRPPKPVRNSLYRCEACCITERIPAEVLAYFDAVDSGNPGEPATFQCGSCPGIMYPDWWFRAERATP